MSFKTFFGRTVRPYTIKNRDLREQSEDESLVSLKLILVLGLQFADERLAALEVVHGPDEAEEGILVAGHGGVHS